MKAVLAAFVLTLVSFDALAIQRYTSTSMTCNEVRATIRREGAALMRYMSKRVPGLPLHGRYVVDDRFCDMGEYADYAYIRASDTDSCPVRECKPIEYDDEFIFRRH